LICHKEGLIDGLETITLTINDSPNFEFTSISILSFQTTINRPKDSEIIPTNPLTTIDNNQRTVSLVTYEIINGNLPNGLSFDSNTGVIRGIPTNIETSVFRIRATGKDNSLWQGLQCESSDVTFNIVLPDPTKLIMSDLPSFIYGPQYMPIINTGSIEVIDDNGKLATAEFSSPNIPSGLEINISTGVISGTPNTIGAGIFKIICSGTNS
jgi:hypothetical protein